MFEAGATLVQVYTGFVYNGLGFAGNLCKGLIEPTPEIEIAVDDNNADSNNQ
jgi:dihydroorotate dehydrogenase